MRNLIKRYIMNKSRVKVDEGVKGNSHCIANNRVVNWLSMCRGLEPKL